MKALEVPNDPLFGQLYGMSQANDRDIDAPEGWTRAGGIAGTAGLKVGIVDTGIDRNHEDIGSARIVNCAATKPAFLGIVGADPNPLESRGCADDNDHGTHVAGTIGALATTPRAWRAFPPTRNSGSARRCTARPAPARPPAWRTASPTTGRSRRAGPKDWGRPGSR